MAPKKTTAKPHKVVAEAPAAVPVAAAPTSDTNVFSKVLQNYSKQSTPKLKLVDSFLAFLVALGVFQFVFCVLVGNFVSIECRGWRDSDGVMTDWLSWIMNG